MSEPRSPYMVPDVPRRLWAAWVAGLLSVEDLRWVLPAAWAKADRPMRLLAPRVWRILFRAAGYVSDAGLPRPTAPMRIYAATMGPWQQMSWTEDLDVARWFARREEMIFGRRPAVWTALVPPEGVLARIAGRREAEVVVDPSTLADIEKVDRAGAQS